MAMNPMQRRAKNAFLIGLLLGLVIMAVVVMLLWQQNKGLQKKYDDLANLQKMVYVAKEDMKSGTEITSADFDSCFEEEEVRTTLSEENFIEEKDFMNFDEKTQQEVENVDSENNLKRKAMVLKTNVPAGTIVTKDMLEESNEVISPDQRLQEYNMIILPKLLTNGDYVDIRFKLPTGEDYIVLSKKRVVYTDETTIWMKMTEGEILILGNAIVEAYTIVGSKLYATSYTEPGRQAATEATYPINDQVKRLIEQDPNIVKEAKEGIWSRYNSDNMGQEQRRDHINKALEDYEDGMSETVQSGVQEEVTKIQESRKAYVESLDGTGSVGTDNAE